jgi:hypothetical protein
VTAARGGPVSLHVHSCHSPLWGVAEPGALAERAAALGYDTLALTDRNGLCGLHYFLEEALRCSLRAVVGAEIQKNEDRALCWVRDAAGYRNLCHLLSALHGDPEATVATLLARHRKGLVVASDQARVLGALARDGREDLYVEVSPGHAMHRALAAARSRHLPPLATVRTMGLDAADWAVHRVLGAVAAKTTVLPGPRGHGGPGGPAGGAGTPGGGVSPLPRRRGPHSPGGRGVPLARSRDGVRVPRLPGPRAGTGGAGAAAASTGRRVPALRGALSSGDGMVGERTGPDLRQGLRFLFPRGGGHRVREPAHQWR